MCLVSAMPTRRDQGGTAGRDDVQFGNWRLYGERGLADEPASIRGTDKEVEIQFTEESLSGYGVIHQRDHRHFRQVTLKRIFETNDQSLRPPVLELDPDDWWLVIELPRRRRHRRRHSTLMQAALFSSDQAVVSR